MSPLRAAAAVLTGSAVLTHDLLTALRHADPDGTGRAIDVGPRFDEHRWVAHALVARDGRYLVLRRLDGRYLGGHWDVPGGSVEAGETLRAAAARETVEEAGLHVLITAEVTHFTNADTEGRPICFHTVTFHGLETAPEPVLLSPTEHDAFRWLRPEEALELPLVWHVRQTFSGLAGVEPRRW